MEKINTNRIAIEQAIERSIATILPSREALINELMSGKKMKFYIGCDATGPDLHIGHATNFLLLERLRKLGHEIIVLFGDFTARIGDPTGRDTERKMLSEAEVGENISNWTHQVGCALNLNDAHNPVRIEKNSSWLGKLGFAEVLDLASSFTAQQMIERDIFDKRWKNKKPIYLHEFLYPLMQGYDSVALGVDGEVGGNDQTFNMLTGRTLLKKYKNTEKFVIATTLLINPKTGKKLMSKSEGRYVALSATPNDMFGGVMALPDEAISQLFIDCTEVPITEVGQWEQKLKDGVNPRDAKIHLATEIVTRFHSRTDAEKARASFRSTFGEGRPQEFVDVPQASAAETLLEKGIISSKTDLRRLIADGAITEVGSGKKQGEDFMKNPPPGEYRLGKHRFVRIV